MAGKGEKGIIRERMETEMKHGMKILFGVLLCVGLLCVPGKSASADAVVSGEDTSYDRYIAFGQDLKASEKQKVSRICQTTRLLRSPIRRSTIIWETILIPR